MPQTCPACGSELGTPDSQNYCGSCSEPINIDVDRERIRDRTTGFLGLSERSRIVDDINGERVQNTHHEYTHVTVQEEARRALFDFWLLAECEAFDNRKILLGDLQRYDVDERDRDEDLRDMNALVGLFRMILTSMTMEAIEAQFELALRKEFQNQPDIDSDDVGDLDFEILLNGEPAKEVLASTD